MSIPAIGRWVALVAAVALTAKGEYDLAVAAHYHKGLAVLFPAMLDVYAVVAFAKRRHGDVIAGLALMLGCQIAAHLLPVYIDPGAGEQTPWGLVMAVACVPPIVLLRTHALGGTSRAEAEAEAEAERRAEALRAAEAEAAAAKRKMAEAEQRLRAEAERRAEAEAAAAERAEAAAEIARLHRQLDEVQTSARAAREEAAQALEARAEAEAREAEARAEIRRIKAEAGGRKDAGVPAPGGRKNVRVLPTALTSPLPAPSGPLPVVEGVRPETVAAVLAAVSRHPEATQQEIAEVSGVSDRTVRKVLRGIPADHPALALGDQQRAAI